MKSFVKNALVGLSFAASILLVSSTTAHAQVLAGSGEVAAGGGWLRATPSGSPNFYSFGFDGVYNATRNVGLGGEYGYAHASVSGVGVSVQTFGGVARFSFLSKTKVVPYGVFAGGGSDISATIGGCTESCSGSVTGGYFSGGGGASFYITPSVGVRPEYRFGRLEAQGSGINYNQFTGAIFFQFGGHAKK